MGIPIGKLSLYAACAGLHPAMTLPILLDTGTDNRERLADPIYIGWRHERVRGADYDNFMEQFVTAVERRWPHVLLQWGDFARPNAGRILERYRDRLCAFNDDIQGTAAVAAGTCSQPRTSPARRRFFAVDRDEGMEDLQPFQAPFVQPRAAVDGWTRSRSDRIDLFDVVKNARPMVLIGVSGQPGMFTEEVVRTMAGTVARPVIFPLSNRVSRSEAIPADLLRWTDGRALVGTGSPSPPVDIDGKPITVDQTSNAYIFPGVGLGVLAVKARRVSDDMFAAAAKALAGVSPALCDSDANLLPPVGDLRSVGVTAAAARQARAEGLCEAFDDSVLDGLIAQKMWEPVYRPYHRNGANPHGQIH
jgi:malate dehydrogenase (oxaloacetate-decarboxylating)